MAKSISGFIVIADISGYTRFLSRSELEHAQEILQVLLKLLIDQTKVPLLISRLEGDAVISYAPAGSFLQSSSLLEMVNSTYVAFRQALDLMVLNTTCTCNACKNIPDLDLKFFLHYGTFGLQPLPAYTELIGTDVNLVHRLTKNHVKEKTGLEAYALFTRQALAALGLQDLENGMTALTETYEHIEPVDVFVQDLQELWMQERDHVRIQIKPGDAIAVVESDFPVAPIQLFEYMTKPEYRAVYLKSDSAVAHNLQRGRVGEGTVYYCAHGDNNHPQVIVDWQPFTSFTINDEFMPGNFNHVTYQISPGPQGSRLKVLVGPALEAKPVKRWVFNRVLALIYPMFSPLGVKALRDRMLLDLNEGLIHLPEPNPFDPEEVGKSIRVALEAAAAGSSPGG